MANNDMTAWEDLEATEQPYFLCATKERTPGAPVRLHEIGRPGSPSDAVTAQCSGLEILAFARMPRAPAPTLITHPPSWWRDWSFDQRAPIAEWRTDAAPAPDGYYLIFASGKPAKKRKPQPRVCLSSRTNGWWNTGLRIAAWAPIPTTVLGQLAPFWP